MQDIIQLSTNLANKIAAGEVVERPASVVKELVENAIDASSTIIEIEIEEAGLNKIRIVDNGNGIKSSQVKKAFERHATSKIKDENDLFRIRSLGFRGEALPSIASVAKLKVKTCQHTEEAGTKVIIEGGEVITVEKCASRKGTDITVTDLFYNTPARLKYMRSLHTELGNITDIVNRLALAHPKVSFKLTHNGSKIMQTNGNGDTRQVIAAIYGFKIAQKMLPISAESLDYQIDGFISLPEVSRATRNYMSVLINGRFIKSYQVASAITEGYHTLLPIGRFPIVVINIKMDPILIDVNVHPTKLEVRISKEKELKQLISRTIKNAFKKETLIPAGAAPKNIIKKSNDQQSFSLEPKENVTEQISDQNISVRSEIKSEDIHQVSKNDIFTNSDIASNYTHTSHDEQEYNNTSILISETNEPLTDETKATVYIAENELKNDVETRIPPLYPIGQMHGTYIFAQNDKGLYMIDQHAAQERIKYEFFKEKLGKVCNDLQQLLVPLTLNYSSDEIFKIEQHKDELIKFGITLEQFGYNSYIVREHPSWFPQGEEEETIEQMIEQVLATNKIDIGKLREELAIMMSCKGSIKANHHLRHDEIEALLNELRMTSDPFTCPHGHPIIIHYPTYELEKMFKRVM